MRLCEDLKERLDYFASHSELDPFSFKREMLIYFMVLSRGFDQLLTRGSIENVISNKIQLAYDAVLKNSISFNRYISQIEIALWILDDNEAIDYITDEINYKPNALPVIHYLMNRYKI